ncbi:hypothetical protein NDU88_004921 [Pleurodeles waltl]|uniref:Uncharacterized protein n=1 Tax=Pleurodeles waltl TaxID=8319 RepID=A0AAV7MVZ6_PLEWA|nr:hypothetical protein NDU88_004921 [Pleurodeles waltl]
MQTPTPRTDPREGLARPSPKRGPPERILSGQEATGEKITKWQSGVNRHPHGEGQTEEGSATKAGEEHYGGVNPDTTAIINGTQAQSALFR